MSALSVKNVSKIFPALNNKNQSVQALQDVSLEVNENEFVSILGHSGCGKTTLKIQALTVQWFFKTMHCFLG
jgi:ABC-type oligopeptide transport system ATPase subunit